jgi:hypothetical protein
MFWKSFLVAFLLDNKKYFYSSKKNNSVIQMSDTSINYLFKQNMRFSDGCDHTFNETDNEKLDNEKLLIKIRENYKKMELLRTLESINLSLESKIIIIDEYKRYNEPKIKTINIKDGGLFKDWDNI